VKIRAEAPLPAPVPCARASRKPGRRPPRG
jgi:hypothetical protein